MIITEKEFYFVRHGETDFNKKNIYMGQKDIPLNEEGKNQAEAIKKIIQNLNIETIISSPLKHAYTTAEIIAEDIPIDIIDNLKEATWGVLEGKLKDDGSLMIAWRNGEIFQNGESFEDFKLRVYSAVNKTLEFPGPVLIVAHGGVYWALKQYFNLPFIDLNNCEIIHHIPPRSDKDCWQVYSLKK